MATTSSPVTDVLHSENHSKLSAEEIAKAVERHNKNWPAILASVCAVTVGLGAQAPTSAQPPSAQPEASKSVTFSGCVEKAAPDAAAPAAAASAPAFILTNASPAGSGGGAVGTGGSAKPAAAKYRLDADDAKLSPHVGHKVEVTGTIDDKAMPSAPSGAAAASAGPKLKVDSIKMVAATCS
jgi:hypothetical protein